MKKNILFRAVFALGLVGVITACSDDPSPGSGNVTKGSYVIGVTATDSKSYLLATDNLDSGTVSISGNGAEASEATVYPYDNGKKGFLFLYRKGDPSTMQSCKFLNTGKLQVNKFIEMPTRKEFIGYYKNYMVAMTSIQLADGKYGEAFNFINGETELVEIKASLSTENLVHQGEYVNMGGLITIGEDMVTALEPYQIPAAGTTTSGPTAYPDEVNIAVLNKNGNDVVVKKVIKDDRSSYAVGRRRSGRLSCIGAAGDGNIYVFSPANQRNDGTSAAPKPVNVSKHPSSVLKIDKNTLEFDKSYYYSIEAKSGGLKLQNAFPLYGNYFLLNMFATENAYNMQLANKFAIFNVSNGEFVWVDGLPSPSDIGGYSPEPFVEGEKVYLPLTAAGLTYVYVIDAKTGKAVKGVEVIGDLTIGGVTKLVVPE